MHLSQHVNPAIELLKSMLSGPGTSRLSPAPPDHGKSWPHMLASASTMWKHLVASAGSHQATPDLGLPRIGQAGGAVSFLSRHREQQNREKPFHLGSFVVSPLCHLLAL